MMNFLYILSTIFLLTITLDTYAQQVQKESNDDLRVSNTKFSFQRFGDETKFELIENEGNFLFVHAAKSSPQATKKISMQQAEKIDQLFIGKFVQVKYNYPNFSGKKCRLVFKMTMRDETHEVCEGEKDKILVAESMLLDLKENL